MHGNLPALEAVLPDAGESTASSSAATTRCSVAGRGRRSSACTSCRRCGSAATPTAALAAHRRRRPTTRCSPAPWPQRAPRWAASSSPTSPRCPSAPRDGDTLYCHASPGLGRALVLPRAEARRAGAAGRERRRRAWSSATPTSPFRRVTGGGIELINPGSVGLPFDGDTRAAYAVAARRRHGRAPPCRLRPRGQRGQGARPRRAGASAIAAPDRAARALRWPSASSSTSSTRSRSATRSRRCTTPTATTRPTRRAGSASRSTPRRRSSSPTCARSSSTPTRSTTRSSRPGTHPLTLPREWDWVLDDPRRHQSFQTETFAGMRDYYAASDAHLIAREAAHRRLRAASYLPHQPLRLALEPAPLERARSP